MFLIRRKIADDPTSEVSMHISSRFEAKVDEADFIRIYFAGKYEIGMTQLEWLTLKQTIGDGSKPEIS